MSTFSYDSIPFGVKASNLPAVANFSSTLDDSYILIIANNCNTPVYNNPNSYDLVYNSFDNAALFGANKISDTNGTKQHEAYIAIKSQDTIKKIAQFNETNATVNANIIPLENSTYNLGSSALKWKDIYATNLYGDGSHLTNVFTDASFDTRIATKTLDDLKDGSKNRFVIDNNYKGNFNVEGTLSACNLVIEGDTTVLNTSLYQTEKMEITNDASGPALKITQNTNTGDVLQVYTNDTIALSVIHGGSVGIKTDSPEYDLDVNGSARAQSFLGDGANITNINLQDKTTAHLAEDPDGTNLYFTHMRTGLIAEASNIHTSNYIKAVDNSFGDKFDTRLLTKTLDDIRNGTTHKFITNDIYTGSLKVTQSLTVNDLEVTNSFVFNKIVEQTVSSASRTAIYNESIGPALKITQNDRAAENNKTAYNVLEAYTGEGIALSIIQNGYVGINKLTPAYNLDVDGTARATNFKGEGSMITNINLVGKSTRYLLEDPDGSNLYFTHLRAAAVVDTSNIDTCNFVTSTSNQVSRNLNLNSTNSSNYTDYTSNLITLHIQDTSNLLTLHIKNTCNYVDFTSNLLALHIQHTSNYVDYTSNLLALYVHDTSNLVSLHIKNTCNYVDFTSNLLALHIHDTCNYVDYTSNIITLYMQDTSNLITLHIINRNIDTSNYVDYTSNLIALDIRSTCNIVSSHIQDTCNYVDYTSNLTTLHIYDASTNVSNFTRLTCNIILDKVSRNDYDTCNFIKDTSNKLVEQLHIVNTFIDNISTDDVDEGDNLYYTDQRFDTRLLSKTLDTIHQGTSNKFILNNNYRGNLNVEGTLSACNLVIEGDTTVLNTTLYATERVEILNKSNGPAFKVTQTLTGAEDIFQVYKNTAAIFKINADGYVGINKADPIYALDVLGSINATNIIADGEKISNVNLADKSSRFLLEDPDGSNLYYTPQRVGIIATASNIHTSNYVRTSSNALADMINLLNINQSNYVRATCNIISREVNRTYAQSLEYTKTTTDRLSANMTANDNFLSTFISNTSNLLASHTNRLNANMSNYVLISSNQISRRLTDTSNTITDYMMNYVAVELKNTSNQISNKLTNTSNTITDYMVNYIGVKLIQTSNELMNRLNVTTSDDIPEGQHNKYIIDNVYNNDLYVSGRLTVDGTTTTLNTTTYQTERLEIVSSSQGPALKVQQYGIHDILSLYDDDTLVFKVSNGGNLKLTGSINNTSSNEIEYVRGVKAPIQKQINNLTNELIDISDTFYNSISDTHYQLSNQISLTSNNLVISTKLTSNDLTNKISDLYSYINTTADDFNRSIFNVTNPISTDLQNTTIQLEELSNEIKTTSNMLHHFVSDTSNIFFNDLLLTSNIIYTLHNETDKNIRDTSNDLQTSLSNTSSELYDFVLQTSDLLAYEIIDTSNELSSLLYNTSNTITAALYTSSNDLIANTENMTKALDNKLIHTSNQITEDRIYSINIVTDLLIHTSNVLYDDILSTSNELIDSLGDLNTFVIDTSNTLHDFTKSTSNDLRHQIIQISYENSISSNDLISFMHDTSNHLMQSILTTSNDLIMTADVIVDIIEYTSNELYHDFVNIVSASSNVLIAKINEDRVFSEVLYDRLIANSNELFVLVEHTSNELVDMIHLNSQYTLDVDASLHDTSNILSQSIADITNIIDVKLDYLESFIADTCNILQIQIHDTSNDIQRQLDIIMNVDYALSDDITNVSNMLIATSNVLYNMIFTTSNQLYTDLYGNVNMDTMSFSNYVDSVSTRITNLTSDDLREGTKNRYIVDDKYERDIVFTETATATTLVTKSLIDFGGIDIRNDMYYTPSLMIKHGNDADVLNISVGNVPKLVMRNNGFVGFHTDFPEYDVDVAGVLNATRLSGDGGLLQNVNLSDKNTDDIIEGTCNLYFREGRLDEMIMSKSIDMFQPGSNMSIIRNGVYYGSLLIAGQLTVNSLKILDINAPYISSNASNFGNGIFEEGSELYEGSKASLALVSNLDYDIKYVSNMLLDTIDNLNNITITSLDQVGNGTSNKYIVNNWYDNALNINGRMQAQYVGGDGMFLTNVNLLDKTTDHLAEGYNKWYYTQDRFVDSIQSINADYLNNGTCNQFIVNGVYEGDLIITGDLTVSRVQILDIFANVLNSNYETNYYQSSNSYVQSLASFIRNVNQSLVNEMKNYDRKLNSIMTCNMDETILGMIANDSNLLLRRFGETIDYVNQNVSNLNDEIYENMSNLIVYVNENVSRVDYYYTIDESSKRLLADIVNSSNRSIYEKINSLNTNDVKEGNNLYFTPKRTGAICYASNLHVSNYVDLHIHELNRKLDDSNITSINSIKYNVDLLNDIIEYCNIDSSNYVDLNTNKLENRISYLTLDEIGMGCNNSYIRNNVYDGYLIVTGGIITNNIVISDLDEAYLMLSSNIKDMLASRTFKSSSNTYLQYLINKVNEQSEITEDNYNNIIKLTSNFDITIELLKNIDTNASSSVNSNTFNILASNIAVATDRIYALEEKTLLVNNNTYDVLNSNIAVATYRIHELEETVLLINSNTYNVLNSKISDLDGRSVTSNTRLNIHEYNIFHNSNEIQKLRYELYHAKDRINQLENVNSMQTYQINTLNNNMTNVLSKLAIIERLNIVSEQINVANTESITSNISETINTVEIIASSLTSLIEIPNIPNTGIVLIDNPTNDLGILQTNIENILEQVITYEKEVFSLFEFPPMQIDIPDMQIPVNYYTENEEQNNRLYSITSNAQLIQNKIQTMKAYFDALFVFAYTI
jgi:hypothetical protein